MKKTKTKEQLYALKNGRLVKEGDNVSVRLTPRIIKYFVSIGALKPIKESELTEDDILNALVCVMERCLYGI